MIARYADKITRVRRGAWRLIRWLIHRHPVLFALWLLVCAVLLVNAWQACWEAGRVSVERQVRIVSLFDFSDIRQIRGSRGVQSGEGMGLRFNRFQVNCKVVAGGESCFIDVGESRERFQRYREGQQVTTTVVLNKPAGLFAWTREAAAFAWFILIATVVWLLAVGVVESGRKPEKGSRGEQ